MNSSAQRFVLSKDQRLSWSLLALGPRPDGLRGISKAARRYSFFWARNAIYHSLKALGVSPGERVLVPAYICSAAVESIAAYGAEVIFYAVRRDCTPDFADVESRIDALTRAVLLVHYFGFAQPVRQFQEICQRHGLALIEDCAHVLAGELDGRALGSFGDASVFSWAKFLPVYDGGELVLNRWKQEPDVPWRHESLLFTLKVAKSLVDQLVEPNSHSLVRIPYRALEASRSVLRGLVTDWTRKTVLSIDGNSAAFDSEMVDFPMTRLSRRILRHSNIERIVARRRENYFYLLQKLSGVHGLRLLFPTLPEGVCPWVFPLFIEGMPNAHLRLRQLGIPAVTWGGVRCPDIDKSVFPEADFLYENLVFLPVHQNLVQSDLEKIVQAAIALAQQTRNELPAQPSWKVS